VPVSHVKSLLAKFFKLVFRLAEINVGKVYPPIKVGVEEIKPAITWGHFLEKVGVLLDFGIYRILKGEVAEVLRKWLKRFFGKVNPGIRPWFRGIHRITTAVPKESNEDKAEK
jgi:hypothetical protein